VAVDVEEQRPQLQAIFEAAIDGNKGTKHSTVDRIMICLTVLQAGLGCVLSPSYLLFDKQLTSVATPLSNHSSTLLNMIKVKTALPTTRQHINTIE